MLSLCFNPTRAEVPVWLHSGGLANPPYENTAEKMGKSRAPGGYLIPTTMDWSAVSGSDHTRPKPASFIQPKHSAAE